jgi:bifunctional DNA-binding transcriptional regulator/antitoxin component of YhaV-PrlF toxin-antitoxin module
MSTTSVQIRRKGLITLPVELRRQYNFKEGDVLTLVDLGEGALLLVPRVSQVARLGDQVADLMESQDVSLEDMLEALDQEREDYYREHYAET